MFKLVLKGSRNFWCIKKIFTAWKVSVFGVFLFSHIQSEYGKIRRISQYSVQILEKTDQKNSEYRHFLRSTYLKEVATIQRSFTIPNAEGSDFKYYKVSDYKIMLSKITVWLTSDQQLPQKFEKNHQSLWWRLFRE